MFYLTKNIQKDDNGLDFTRNVMLIGLCLKTLVEQPITYPNYSENIILRVQIGYAMSFNKDMCKS